MVRPTGTSSGPVIIALSGSAVGASCANEERGSTRRSAAMVNVLNCIEVECRRTTFCAFASSERDLLLGVVPYISLADQ